ncbi:hypothetical protein [Clostridium sp.]
MSDCNSCSSKDGCNKDKGSCMIENNPLNNVKKIIAVMSGISFNDSSKSC